MKKIFYALFTVLLMGVYVGNVDAATNFTFDGWNTASGYYGTATKVSDNITNLKGREDAIGGMYLGPFNKQGDKAALLDGIKEQTHVELNFDTMAFHEYFETSLALKNGAGNYVAEAVVMTQKITEDQIRITSGWSDFEAIVTETGVYTYQWEVFVEEEKTYVIFSLLNNDKVIATTGKVDFDGIDTVDTLNPIAEEEGVTVKYLWFCNVNVAKGINVYTTLPTLTIDEKVDEKNANIIIESIKNDDTLKDVVATQDTSISLTIEPIEKVEEEVKEEFSKVVKDSVVLDFVDISILVETKNDEYKLTNLNKEIALQVTLPNDLPKVAKGYSRKFFILRQHDNQIEKIDATLSEDGKVLSFNTDKFSTYAIAYVDEILPPKTGDNIMFYVTLALISLIGLSFIINKAKKQFN